MARNRYEVVKDDQPPQVIQEAQEYEGYYPLQPPEGFMYLPVNHEHILGCLRCGLITTDWEAAVTKHNEWHTLVESTIATLRSDAEAAIAQLRMDAKAYTDLLRSDAINGIGGVQSSLAALTQQTTTAVTNINATLTSLDARLNNLEG